MTIRILLLLLLGGPLGGRVAAQPSRAETDAIVAEGFELFHLQLAAWQASDAVLGEVADLEVDAYFTYRDGDSLRTVYYMRAQPEQVVGEVAFDEDANIASKRMQWRGRPRSPREQALMLMREHVLLAIAADKKGYFRTYPATGTNILLLPGAKPVAYLLTLPMEPGVVLIGNDYKFEFDAAGKVANYKRLHADLRSIPTTEDAEASAHAHQKGESPYMTATDICTLLLYGQNTTWHHHMVVHPKFVSTWSLDERTLLVLTGKAWDRIVDHQNSKQ